MKKLHPGAVLPEGTKLALPHGDHGVAAAAPRFIYKDKGDAVPFDLRAMDAILAMFGILPGSDKAAQVADTLRTCGELTAAGGEEPRHLPRGGARLRRLGAGHQRAARGHHARAREGAPQVRGSGRRRRPDRRRRRGGVPPYAISIRGVLLPPASRRGGAEGRPPRRRRRGPGRRHCRRRVPRQHHHLGQCLLRAPQGKPWRRHLPLHAAGLCSVASQLRRY